MVNLNQSEGGTFRDLSRLPELSGDAYAWVAAVLSFGVGDIVTTTIGVHRYGLPEINPFYATLFDATGTVLPVLLVTKAVGFLLLWELYLRMDAYEGAIPVGVAVAGLVITLLNAAALFLVSGAVA